VMRRASVARQSREWSSRMFKISTSEPSASRQWVMSACQRSFGCSAQKVRRDDRGVGVRPHVSVEVRPDVSVSAG
jgi:hypothetical protein